jgi:hypothetical protein
VLGTVILRSLLMVASRAMDKMRLSRSQIGVEQTPQNTECSEACAAI